MPTQLDWRQIKDSSIPSSKIIGWVGGSLTFDAVSASQSISVGFLYAVDCTTWDVILTLPDWTVEWESLSIKKIDSTNNEVFINNANIDGESSIIISIQNESIDLYWTGTQFIIH